MNYKGSLEFFNGLLGEKTTATIDTKYLLNVLIEWAFPNPKISGLMIKIKQNKQQQTAINNQQQTTKQQQTEYEKKINQRP